MTNAMATFGIAAAGTALLCYVLVTRSQNRKRKYQPSGDSSSNDGTNYASGDGWHIASWFGGDNSASDGSDNPSDGGGGDSGGGGDGGGGDGGGD